MDRGSKDDVLLRLRKIEGQVRGLQRMIVEEKDCEEVVRQLCAARKALDKVGFLIVTHRMQECIQRKQGEGYDADKAMDDAMKLFLSLA